MTTEKKLEELKELTAVNLRREFEELEDAALTTIQYAGRCDVDLLFARFNQAHRSANLLKRRTVERYTDGLITVGELGSILNIADTIVYTELPDEIKGSLKTRCSCRFV